MKGMIFLILGLIGSHVCAEEAMNQQNMEAIVKAMAEKSQGEKGVVEFTIEGMNLYLISDVNHDRMRIITPIIEYEKITKEQMTRIMESNFHSALDARYAMSDDILYSVFIHPMSKLDEVQIKSAVVQVFNLRASFGSDYSSGVLDFGTSQEEIF